ncbi:MAG: TolC family protein [Betaproteobacteria bacterium]|nr:TolC family protein [Betaproteobacteria bacterium]
MTFLLPPHLARRPLSALGLAVCALLSPAAAADSLEPLPLADALRIAAGQSPQQAAAAAAARAASEAAIAAGELPDPVLKFGLENFPIEGADRFSIAREPMTMRRIGVMQEMPRAGKLTLRRERFEAEAVRERIGGTAALSTLQRDTALAWLDRYFAERQLDALRELVVEARLAIDGAEIAYRSNRGMRPDIAAARSAVAQLDDRTDQLERQRKTAVIQLARFVGDAAERPLGAGPDWISPPAHASRLEDSMAHHPDLEGLAQQAAIADIDVRLARLAKQPDWSWEVTYQRRGSSFGDMVSFGISIPLPLWTANRQDRDVAAKVATLEQVQAQREEMRRAHLAEARAMVAEWESLRARLARYDASLLPLARERAAATLDAYRAGAAMLTQVLDARRAEIDVRIVRLELERDFARVWAQLAYLIPAGTPGHANVETTK